MIKNTIFPLDQSSALKRFRVAKPLYPEIAGATLTSYSPYRFFPCLPLGYAELAVIIYKLIPTSLIVSAF
jgi:hypothetical protein